VPGVTGVGQRDGGDSAVPGLGALAGDKTRPGQPIDQLGDRCAASPIQEEEDS
jgi:hypothetical protein